ncbi:MAG: hypothetical protein V7642_3776 [Burkholderiales bacterium]
MSEQFLNGSNVVSGLQQVSRKAVAQRVGRSRLSESGCNHRPFDGVLNPLLIDVMAPHYPVSWINGLMVRGE